MQETTLKSLNMPMLALRGIVVYPKTAVHFDVIRPKSIEALNTAMSQNRYIFLLTQKNIAAEDPNVDDLYEIGCVAKVRQILRLSGDTVRVLVEGCYRAKLQSITTVEPLSYEGRTDEIARTLGGQSITEIAKENARQLISDAEKIQKQIKTKSEGK